jgi:hypothetical protein
MYMPVGRQRGSWLNLIYLHAAKSHGYQSLDALSCCVDMVLGGLNDSVIYVLVGYNVLAVK